MAADSISVEEMKVILALMQAIESIKPDADIYPEGNIEIYSNVCGKPVGVIEIDCEDHTFCTYHPYDIDAAPYQESEATNDAT